MPKINVLHAFKHAEHGCIVSDYAPGQVADVSDDCADVALLEGWAELADAPKADAPARNKAKAAPKNK